MEPTRIIAVVGISMLALAACSTADTPAPDAGEVTSSESPGSVTPTESSSEAESEPDPAIDPQQRWNRALETTTAAGQTDIDAQLITNVEGFERIELGDGLVDITTGFGDITWTDDRAVIREIRSANGHFVELDGTWFDEPMNLPTTVAFEPLSGLESPESVQAEGTEDVLGVPTMKFTAQLPPDGVVMGFSTEETTVFDPTTGSLTATIWIDEADRILRVLREYATRSTDGDSVEAVSLFVFDGFGPATPIDVPETADAIPAPA